MTRRAPIPSKCANRMHLARKFENFAIYDGLCIIISSLLRRGRVRSALKNVTGSHACAQLRELRDKTLCRSRCNIEGGCQRRRVSFAVEIPFAKVLAFALSLAAPGTAFVVVSCVKTGAASGTKSSNRIPSRRRTRKFLSHPSNQSMDRLIDGIATHSLYSSVQSRVALNTNRSRLCLCTCVSRRE